MIAAPSNANCNTPWESCRESHPHPLYSKPHVVSSVPWAIEEQVFLPPFNSIWHLLYHLQLVMYLLQISDSSYLLLSSSLTSISSSVRTRCLILGWDQTIYQHLGLVCFTGSGFYLTVWSTKILMKKECSIPLPGFKSGTEILAHHTGTRWRLNELTYSHICFKISLNQKHINQMRSIEITWSPLTFFMLPCNTTTWFV